MRTFKLDRHQDLSGNSGTGIVAEGVEFSDGTVALRWLTDTATTTFYNSMDDVIQLHHHEGATEIIFDEVNMNPSEELRKIADGLKAAENPWGGDYEIRVREDRYYVKETDGPELGNFDTKEDAYQFIQDRMMHREFYSDVWLIGDYYDDRQKITDEVLFRD